MHLCATPCSCALRCERLFEDTRSQRTKQPSQVAVSPNMLRLCVHTCRCEATGVQGKPSAAPWCRRLLLGITVRRSSSMGSNASVRVDKRCAADTHACSLVELMGLWTVLRGACLFTAGIATNYGGPADGKDPYSPSWGTAVVRGLLLLLALLMPRPCANASTKHAHISSSISAAGPVI